MKIITHAVSRPRRGRNLTLCYGVHDFPVGKILVALTAEGLCWLGINCTLARFKSDWPGAEFVEDRAVTARVARDIARLWPNGLHRLTLPVVLYGTAFQLKVWKALLNIKPGSTVSYATVARRIGRPRAVRAVGSAVGKNTVSIVVPCHRVVNATGNKISYGWGPKVKTALLKGEKAA